MKAAMATSGALPSSARTAPTILPSPTLPSPPPTSARPHADNLNCSGGGTTTSTNLGECNGDCLASPPGPKNPTTGTSYSCCSSDEDEPAGADSSLHRIPCSSGSTAGYSVDNSGGKALLASRDLRSRALPYDSEEESSSIAFSDRTGCTSTPSTSSPDAFDFPEEASLHNPLYWGMHQEVLGSLFWTDGRGISDGSSASSIFPECKILVHQKKPISSLAAEYGAESKNMRDKLNMLFPSHPEYREIAGDGNCCFRSFIYSYLEQLVEDQASDSEELRLLRSLGPMWEKFQRLHWPDPYTDLLEDFEILIFSCVERKQASGYHSWLHNESQNKEKSARTISFLRLVTAIEICSTPEQFSHCIHEPDLVRYCRRKVVRMDKDANHEALVALSQVLQVPLQVVYIDNAPSMEGANTHDIYVTSQ